MSRFKLALCSLLLVGFFGCGKADKEDVKVEVQPAPQAPPVQEPTATPPAAPESPAASQPTAAPQRAAKKTVAPRKETATAPSRAARSEEEVLPAPQPRATAPALPPQPVSAMLPAGTRIDIRLTEKVSSDDNQSGDRFEALLDDNLEVDGRVVAPKGSTVIGRLSDVEESDKVRGRARMSMTLVELQLRGQSYPIDTNTLSFVAESSKKEDAIKIGGGAGLGAAIGAIAGGKKGAAIGAAIGGGTGTAAVLATKGKEVEFPSEQKFSFKLQQGVQVKIR